MAFNVKTTMTWSVGPEAQPSSLVEARKEWLDAAVAAEKTESNVVTPLSEDGKTSERFWVSQEAAEEWKSFIENLAQENGLTVEVVID